MRLKLIPLMLLAVPLWAQPVMETKLVRLSYVSPEAASNILSKSGVAVAADSRIRALVISGEAQRVAAAEEILKQVDIPQQASSMGRQPTDVEVVVYLLSASAQGASNVPPPLQDVVKQLHGLFPYGSYQLLDSLLIRGAQNMMASVKGVLPDPAHPAGGAQSGYEFFYRLRDIGGERNNRLIRLDDVVFRGKIANTRTPDNNSSTDVNIQSQVALREAQKVVIGKTSLDPSGNSLFLVVTARVIE